MDLAQWHAANKAAIDARLAWLREQPEGILYEKLSPLHRVVVRKVGSQIRLYFVDPRVDAASATPRETSGVMSRIDLNDPLALPSMYAQAMCLTFLWTPNPKRAYVLGYGGGRLPMLLHHWFPEIVVESTEIDPDLVELSRQFFGMEFDERQIVAVQDGREYLEKSDHRFDIIYLDAFRGTGYHPYQLSTLDFYRICGEHLAPGGVVGINLIDSDPLIGKKLNTLEQGFTEVLVFQEAGYMVALASNDPAPDAQLRMKRLEELTSRIAFPFSLKQREAALRPLSEVSIRRSPSDGIVTDANPFGDVLRTVSAENPIFYNADPAAPCPCGSGDVFRLCHGTQKQLPN